MVQNLQPSRPALGATALLLAFVLTACGTRIRDESLGERCADLMQRAFPGGDIEVTGSQVTHDHTASVAAMVATAEGVRKDVSGKGPLRHDVAVECKFQDGVLTSFRWTTGPLR